MASDEGETWTPLRVLQWAVPFLAQKGIPNPKFDAEILIAHALKIDRLKVYLQFDRPLDKDELAVLRDLLRRRSRHEPIQYLTQKREFFGISFKVGPGVLIPRPETEQLVELAIKFLKDLPETERTVLDLGTGSGNIAISLAKNISSKIWAVDISEAALQIARENGELTKAGPIQWRQGSWFSGLETQDPQGFKLILSNPPYIALSEKKELDPEVRDFEPSEALFSGETGLDSYVFLAKNIGNHLVSGGIAILEIHANRSDKILDLFTTNGFKGTVFKDLQGLPRVLQVEKQND